MAGDQKTSTTNQTLGVNAGVPLLALLLGVLLPLVEFPRVAQEDLEPTGYLILAITALAGFKLAWLWGAGRPNLVEIAFWAFVYVWCGLAPLAQATVGWFPSPGLYTDDQVATAVLLVICAIAAFEVGIRLGRARSHPVAPRPTRQLDERRLKIVGIVGLALIPVLAPVAGGFDSFFTSRSALGENLLLSAEGDDARVALTRAAITVPVFVSLYGLLWLRASGAPVVRRNWILFALLAVATIVVSNPISSPRFWFGTVVIALGAAVFPLRSPGRVRAAVIVLVLGLLLVFPVADAFRYSRPVSVATELSADRWVTLDYDAFQQSLNALAFVEDRGHTDGAQALGATLFWVPRAVWPEKPIDTGELLGRHAGYDYLNISSPLWAEAYVDFGWLGVVAAFLVLGWVAARLDRAYRSFAGGLMAVAAPVIAAYLFWLLRGSLLSSISTLTALIGVLALSTRRDTARPAQPRPEGGSAA